MAWPTGHRLGTLRGEKVGEEEAVVPVATDVRPVNRVRAGEKAAEHGDSNRP